MIVTLIRHGATAGNLEKRYIGRTDEGLCPEGMRALQVLAFPPCKAVFCSPMRRCTQTAAILFPKAEQILCDDLRECDFGDFEGKNHHDLNGDVDYQAWIDSGGNAPFPHGESPAQFRKRCVNAFCELTRKSLNTAFFVVHGGTIMAICEAFHGGDFYSYHVPNGGGYRAVWDGKRLSGLEAL